MTMTVEYSLVGMVTTTATLVYNSLSFSRDDSKIGQMAPTTIRMVTTLLSTTMVRELLLYVTCRIHITDQTRLFVFSMLIFWRSLQPQTELFTRDLIKMFFL